MTKNRFKADIIPTASDVESSAEDYFWTDASRLTSLFAQKFGFLCHIREGKYARVLMGLYKLLVCCVEKEDLTNLSIRCNPVSLAPSSDSWTSGEACIPVEMLMRDHVLQNMTDPFDTEAHPEVLINISSGIHASPEVQESLLGCKFCSQARMCVDKAATL